MNLYAYCGNNPQTWVDPFGLYGEETHRSFGEYGDSKFDYARLDRDYSPHSRFIYRHFRSRDDVISDLENACQHGDTRDFEYHMHELQDTYSHGRGTLGIASHAIQRHRPDDPDRNERARQAAQQADRATRFWERIWYKYNPPGSEFPEMLGRYQQQLEELEKLLDKTDPLRDWYEHEQQRGLERSKGANL